MPSSDDDVKSLVMFESGKASDVEETLIFCGISTLVEANRFGLKLNKSIDFK